MNSFTETYSHDEVLGKVEDFMINSGIRWYCTEVCEGHCCIPCKDRSSCDPEKMENRKLVCSLFICPQLLNNVFTYQERRAYYRLDRVIENILKKEIGVGLFRSSLGIGICFNKPDDRIFSLLFPKAEIDEPLSKFDFLTIKDHVKQTEKLWP